MYKGIYIATSGAVLSQTQLEVLTQNLANANTTGYKKDNLSFKEYLMPQETAGPGPDGRAMTTLSEYKTDFSSGVVMKTTNPLDIALEGTGFIALDGNRFTRRGDFTKSLDGYLTSFNGTKVLGSRGPIRLPDGKIDIDQNGGISVNGELVDTIRIVDFKRTDGLAKAGDGIYTTPDKSIPSTASVRQGYVEASNVNPVNEMVRMIQTLREFETYQKAIQTFDDATSQVTNGIGRL